MRNFPKSKLTELQRLACIALDSRGLDALMTDLGWVWRSDCVLCHDAAEAVARAILDDQTRPIEIADEQKVRNFNASVERRSEIAALDRELAGLLPVEETWIESPEDRLRDEIAEKQCYINTLESWLHEEEGS